MFVNSIFSSWSSASTVSVRVERAVLVESALPEAEAITVPLLAVILYDGIYKGTACSVIRYYEPVRSLRKVTVPPSVSILVQAVRPHHSAWELSERYTRRALNHQQTVRESLSNHAYIR